MFPDTFPKPLIPLKHFKKMSAEGSFQVEVTFVNLSDTYPFTEDWLCMWFQLQSCDVDSVEFKEPPGVAIVTLKDLKSLEQACELDRTVFEGYQVLIKSDIGNA